jgi:hypothetical protein|nr:MAG TPA: hypothetical protein [Herelleviridae sp.]
MTKIRVFPHNEKGKIEFTKEELQKLLNEVYNEGKIDSYTISYGSNITTTPYSYSTITANNSSTSIDKNNLTSLTTDVKD